ncbi:hypothetical protein, partial [Crateriforma spongiae]|uniref:hypothetical protein n=1 Tax=Crateriforma spongiae TaxID=2724528 RepID=UPI001F2C4985
MKWEAAVDKIAPELGRQFVRSKVNDCGDVALIKLPQVTSIDCITDEQQVVLSIADQCRVTVARSSV